MDRDELETEVEEWVEDGIIGRDQAEEILARYDEDDDSRLAVVISLMGAVLVGAGVLWYLVGNWEALPRWLRTVLVILAPIGFAGAGDVLARDRTPRVGHALWTLGAAFVGPSLFLLADLWALEFDLEWLLLAWAALALPAGHVRRSRPTTALALFVLAGAVATLEAPTDLPIAVGSLGVIVLALGIRYRVRTERELADAYRLVGTTVLLATLLFFAIEDWNYERLALEPSAVALAMGFGTVVSVAGAGYLGRTGATSRLEVGWAAAGAAALLVSAASISLVPALPSALALLVVHVSVLAVLVATVAVAVDVASSALVNLAAVGLFVQVVLFLGTTIVDAVSGAAALVLSGLALLALAIGLERGRRTVLERMRGSEPTGAGNGPFATGDDAEE